MDTEQIKTRIETLTAQREQLAKRVMAELRKLEQEIAVTQQKHAEMLAKGNTDVANLTGRIEELEDMLKQTAG